MLASLPDGHAVWDPTPSLRTDIFELGDE